MNYLSLGAILFVAYLAVFLESCPGGLRFWLRTQVDLLPTLMVYCGLSCNLTTLTLTAVFSGLCFDSLSSNPLGITVLPLFGVGFAAFQARDLVLRDEFYARVLLGAAASVTVPFVTVLLLWGGGYQPLIGWGSLWQWAVLGVSGGLFAPVCFWFFARVEKALAYERPPESPFRPDREIKRGRD